jgi:hypothetical protein
MSRRATDLFNLVVSTELSGDRSPRRGLGELAGGEGGNPTLR